MRVHNQTVQQVALLKSMGLGDKRMVIPDMCRVLVGQEIGRIKCAIKEKIVVVVVSKYMVLGGCCISNLPIYSL